jgi:hypothetical protein
VAALAVTPANVGEATVGAATAASGTSSSIQETWIDSSVSRELEVTRTSSAV